MIKIIVDMNLPPRWVPVLKAEGWDAAHWSSIGSPGAADAEILRYAKDGGYDDANNEGVLDFVCLRPSAANLTFSRRPLCLCGEYIISACLIQIFD